MSQLEQLTIASSGRTDHGDIPAGTEGSRLGRSVALNFGGQGGALVVGFAASVALARWLGPADRGLLGVIVAVSGLSLAVAGLGLPLTVAYYASRGVAQRSLLKATVLYAGLMAIVLVPGAWLARAPLASLVTHGKAENLLPLAALLVPLTFLVYTTGNQLAGSLQFRYLNIATVLSRVGYLFAIVALVRWAQLGVLGGLLATVLGAALLVVVSVKPLLKRDGWMVDRRRVAEMLTYSRRVQLGAVFAIVNTRLDLILLQFFRPLAEVGRYVVALTLAELVIVLSSAFHASLLPMVARAEDESSLAPIRALRHHGLLAFVAILGVAAGGTAVIVFAYGSAFHAAIVPMLILLPGMWFLGTGTVVEAALLGLGRPGRAAALGGLALAATIGLDLWLIPLLGAPGAALASSLAYAVYGLAGVVLLCRIVGAPFREAFPTRRDIVQYRDVLASVSLRRLVARPLRHDSRGGRA